MKKAKYILVVLILFLNDIFFAADNDVEKKKSLSPRHLAFQYAGNIGLVSIGVGNKIVNDKFFWGFLYGYLPKSKNDVEAHTLALKLGYVAKEKLVSQKIKYAIYGGSGLTYTFTKNTFVSLPAQFPDNYYKPNAFHFLPFIGSRISFKIRDEKFTGLFFEIGTTDDHIYNNLIKKSRYKKSFFNLALGLTYDL